MRQSSANAVRTWELRPYPGLAWRPHDLPDAIFGIAFLFVIVTYIVAVAQIWVSGIFLAVAAYVALLRHFHDAYLRRRIIYRLMDEKLEIWIEGESEPRCTFRMARLADVQPQFVRPSGYGSIELPPGGWASQPRWVNNWNNLVPAAFPCRRLELIPNVTQVAETLRALAANARVSHPA